MVLTPTTSPKTNSKSSAKIFIGLLAIISFLLTRGFELARLFLRLIRVKGLFPWLVQIVFESLMGLATVLLIVGDRTGWNTGLNIRNPDRAGFTQTKEFQRVIINFELVGALELLLQVVNRALVEGDRYTTLQTGEMMAILVGATIKRFAIGLGTYLQQSRSFKRFQGSINRG